MQADTRISTLVLIASVCVAGYSCSGSKPAAEVSSLGTPATGGTGTAIDGASATGAGGGASTGGSVAATGGASGKGPTIDVDAGSDAPAMLDEDSACGTGEADAKLKPVNMFVMFDRSWSMNECGDGSSSNGMMMGMQQALDCPTASRWELTSSALTQFVQDPSAAGINIALRFFPDDNPAPGCDGYSSMGGPGMMGNMGGATLPEPNCDIAACAQPLVDLAPLLTDPAPADAQEAALVTAIQAATPPGPEMPNPNPGTPTYAALGGAEQWATQHQTAHPYEQTAVVLITDGEPFGCDTDSANIARLASDAFANARVLTYVIGLTGSSEAQLNELATAGGTQQAYFVADGSKATADLLAALLAIQGMALRCDFAVPAQDSTGNEIEPTLVNVTYENGDMGPSVAFGNVANADACGTELAWYFDDNAAPTHIYLCPAACDTVTADKAAKLRVLAGCKPRVVTK